jgi:hypothetical protein
MFSSLEAMHYHLGSELRNTGAVWVDVFAGVEGHSIMPGLPPSSSIH